MEPESYQAPDFRELGLLANSWTHEEIIENYPQITKEDIRAALEYSLSPLKEEHIYIVPEKATA